MQCIAAGCASIAEGYGGYCNAHKTRMRRHGHPCQEGVTKTELKPYLAMVTKRAARPANEGLGA